MQLIQAIVIVLVGLAALGWSLFGMTDGAAHGGIGRAVGGFLVFFAMWAYGVRYLTR
jgi:hypothetical protein